MADKRILICARCGSTHTRLIRGGALDRALALVRGQRVIVCGRCGWRGRQTPSTDRRRAMHLEGASVAQAGDDADLIPCDRRGPALESSGPET